MEWALIGVSGKYSRNLDLQCNLLSLRAAPSRHTGPGADVFDLRSADARTAALTTPPSSGTLDEKPFVGSNSWAVAATRTADNTALFANDMHLSLRLPHIWYRVRLIVEAGTQAPRAQDPPCGNRAA